jgi:hypothetical protein
LRVGEAERVETVEAEVMESAVEEEGEAVLAVTRALRICSGEGERTEGRQRRNKQERKGKKEKKKVKLTSLLPVLSGPLKLTVSPSKCVVVNNGWRFELP